jgi:superfamily II DNA or RNA helicase
MVLEAIARIGQPAIVIVHETNLQEQWISEAKRFLGLTDQEIGGCGGKFKKPKFGKLNICMQQSLWKQDKINFYKDRIGFVCLDECQSAAAPTFMITVNSFPAEYRIGVSADEKRRDGKEFLIYDSFGKVLSKVQEEKNGTRIPSKIFLVPTEYVNCDYEETNNHTQLINDLTSNEERNRIIETLIERSLQKKKICLVLTERRAHALQLFFI